MPLKPLADLLCYSGFCSSATFVLRCYGPESAFIHVNYLGWGFNFADCQEILSVRKVLLVLRNVKEQNKQYVKSFLFFTEVSNVKYSHRMVFIKYRQNP